MNNLLNDNKNWIDKYCPEKIDDIIGNKQVISDIKNWLKIFEKTRRLFYKKK
jgi:hypothetical protein